MEWPGLQKSQMVGKPQVLLAASPTASCPLGVGMKLLVLSPLAERHAIGCIGQRQRAQDTDCGYGWNAAILCLPGEAEKDRGIKSSSRALKAPGGEGSRSGETEEEGRLVGGKMEKEKENSRQERRKSERRGRGWVGSMSARRTNQDVIWVAITMDPCKLMCSVIKWSCIYSWLWVCFRHGGDRLSVLLSFRMCPETHCWIMAKKVQAISCQEWKAGSWPHFSSFPQYILQELMSAIFMKDCKDVHAEYNLSICGKGQFPLAQGDFSLLEPMLLLSRKPDPCYE